MAKWVSATEMKGRRRFTCLSMQESTTQDACSKFCVLCLDSKTCSSMTLKEEAIEMRQRDYGKSRTGSKEGKPR